MALILQDQAGNSYSLSVNDVDQSLTLLPVSGVTPSTGSSGVTAYTTDLINRALRASHILAAGEQPNGNDTQDALTIANGMLDQWNAQSLMIFNVARNLYNLNGGQQTYQLGPGAADFNTTRPSRIQQFSVIQTNNPLQPLELPLVDLTTASWAQVPVKAIQASLPSLIYDDNQYPYRNLNLWPIPNVSGLQLAIYAWTPLAQLSLATQLSFPPGYYECLVYNLAVRLALEWPGELTPQLEQAAQMSMSIVKNQNVVIPDLRCDPALNSPQLRSYNWISDTPTRY